MKLCTSLLIVLSVACCALALKLSHRQKVALIEEFKKVIEESDEDDSNPDEDSFDWGTVLDKTILDKLEAAVQSMSAREGVGGQYIDSHQVQEEDSHEASEFDDIGGDIVGGNEMNIENEGQDDGGEHEAPEAGIEDGPHYVPVVNKGPSEILAQIPTDTIFPLKDALRMFQLVQSLQANTPALQKSIHQAAELKQKPHGIQQFLRAMTQNGGLDPTVDLENEMMSPPKLSPRLDYVEVMLNRYRVQSDSQRSLERLLHETLRDNPQTQIDRDELENKRVVVMEAMRQINHLLSQAGIQNEQTQLFGELADLMSGMNYIKPDQPKEPDSQAEAADFIALEEEARRLREKANRDDLAHSQSLPSSLKGQKDVPPFFAEQQSEPEAKPSLADLFGVLKDSNTVNTIAQMIGQSLPTLLKRQKDIPPYHARQQNTPPNSGAQPSLSDLLSKMAAKFTNSDATADKSDDSPPNYMDLLKDFQQGVKRSPDSGSPGDVINGLLKNPLVSEMVTHLAKSLPAYLNQKDGALNGKQHDGLPDFQSLFNKVMQNNQDN